MESKRVGCFGWNHIPFRLFLFGVIVMGMGFVIGLIVGRDDSRAVQLLVSRDRSAIGEVTSSATEQVYFSGQSMPSVSAVRGSLQGFSTNISEVVYLAWALKIHSSSSTSSVLPARPLIPWLDEELLCMFPFVNEFGNTNWGVTYLSRAIRYDRSCSNWRRPPDRTCRTEHLITTERPTDSDIAGFIRSSSFGYQDYSFRDTVQVRPAPGASPEIVSALNEKPTDEEISLRRRKHVWMFGRKKSR